MGETGSGKSTLIKVLLRLYEINMGKILIDEIDILEYDIKSLREQMAIIDQEPFLFSGTIYNNILIGNRQSTMDEVIKASKHQSKPIFMM